MRTTRRLAFGIVVCICVLFATPYSMAQSTTHSTASSASSTAQSSGAQQSDELVLGDGMSVRRLPRYCQGGMPGTGCFYWEPRGFSFGPIALRGFTFAPFQPQLLAFARTFARVPATGRLLASLGVLSGTPYMSASFATRLFASDDRGAHWSPVSWSWMQSAAKFAFDGNTDDGVAVGDSGYVWTTTDGGSTWTDHGSSTGTDYVDVAIADGIIVLVDSRGNVYRSDDHGFERRLIAEGGAVLEAHEHDITVRAGEHTLRVRRGHPTQTVRR